MDTNFNLDAWKNLQHTIKKLKEVALRELKEVKVLPIDAQDKNIYKLDKKIYKLASGKERSGGNAKSALRYILQGQTHCCKNLKQKTKGTRIH